MNYTAKELLSYIYAGLILVGYSKEDGLQWMGTQKQWKDQDLMFGHDCKVEKCKHQSHYES